MERIASLLPAATEIVALLGLTDRLVGRTHECDFPPEVARVPVLTHTALEGAHLSSPEIDRRVGAAASLAHVGSSLYGIDEEAWRAANPSLVLTQELCELCAVSYERVTEAMRLLPGESTVLSLEPHSLAEVIDNIRMVGRLTGRTERAEREIERLQARVEALQRATGELPRPRLLCVEWLDPLYSAGHWVPEQVSLAGGQELLGLAGKPSARVTWDSILAARPEVLILMPCGFEVTRTLAEIELLAGRAGWNSLPAVQQGAVYAVNGHAYFNRPGPRLVDGAELLAALLHPDRFPDFHERFAAEGSWQKVLE